SRSAEYSDRGGDSRRMCRWWLRIVPGLRFPRRLARPRDENRSAGDATGYPARLGRKHTPAAADRTAARARRDSWRQTRGWKTGVEIRDGGRPRAARAIG